MSIKVVLQNRFLQLKNIKNESGRERVKQKSESYSLSSHTNYLYTHRIYAIK